MTGDFFSQRLFLTKSFDSGLLFHTPWLCEATALTSDVEEWSKGWPSDTNVLASYPKSLQKWFRNPATTEKLVEGMAESWWTDYRTSQKNQASTSARRNWSDTMNTEAWRLRQDDRSSASPSDEDDDARPSLSSQVTRNPFFVIL